MIKVNLRSVLFYKGSVQASLTAIKLDVDLKKYYERKVAEGKNKMCVLNAVRNKLLARVMSCVNNKKMYVNKVGEIS